jgi:hypothetical protein
MIRHIAVKICAKNDPSGNPQRGWLVYKTDVWIGAFTSELVEFFDEGYDGIEALRKKFPGVHILTEVDVSRSFYHKMKREFLST